MSENLIIGINGFEDNLRNDMIIIRNLKFVLSFWILDIAEIHKNNENGEKYSDGCKSNGKISMK